jgi:hypothetical protein
MKHAIMSYTPVQWLIDSNAVPHGNLTSVDARGCHGSLRLLVLLLLLIHLLLLLEPCRRSWRCGVHGIRFFLKNRQRTAAGHGLVHLTISEHRPAWSSLPSHHGSLMKHGNHLTSLARGILSFHHHLSIGSGYALKQKHFLLFISYTQGSFSGPSDERDPITQPQT